MGVCQDRMQVMQRFSLKLFVMTTVTARQVHHLSQQMAIAYDPVGTLTVNSPVANILPPVLRHCSSGEGKLIQNYGGVDRQYRTLCRLTTSTLMPHYLVDSTIQHCINDGEYL